MANMDIASVLAEQYERAAHDSEPKSEYARLEEGSGFRFQAKPIAIQSETGTPLGGSRVQHQCRQVF